METHRSERIGMATARLRGVMRRNGKAWQSNGIATHRVAKQRISTACQGKGTAQQGRAKEWHGRTEQGDGEVKQGEA